MTLRTTGPLVLIWLSEKTELNFIFFYNNCISLGGLVYLLYLFPIRMVNFITSVTSESNFKYFLKGDKLYITKRQKAYSPTVFNVTLLFRFFVEPLYVSYLSSSLRPVTVNSLFTPPHYGKGALISDLVTGILILLFLINTFKHTEVKYMLREFKTRAVYYCDRCHT